MLKASKAQVHIFIQLFHNCDLYKVRLEIFLYQLPFSTYYINLCFSFKFSVFHAAFFRGTSRD